MNLQLSIFVLCLALILSACSVKVNQPTSQPKQQANQVTLNKNFDDTWEDMIEFISTSYFGIESFEKESGLLTLSFGAENPGRYIDCGSIAGPFYNGLVL